MTFRLDFYSPEELSDILKRSAHILGVQIALEARHEIASRSRATPRIANRVLKRVRDYAQVKADGNISLDLTKKSLDLMAIDQYGLDDLDRRLLKVIIDNFKGGPVGLNTLAAAVQEEAGTIEEIIEPYLMQLGFLARTAKGRVATPRTYEYFGLKAPEDGKLF